MYIRNLNASNFCRLLFVLTLNVKRKSADPSCEPVTAFFFFVGFVPVQLQDGREDYSSVRFRFNGKIMVPVRHPTVPRKRLS